MGFWSDLFGISDEVRVSGHKVPEIVRDEEGAILPDLKNIEPAISLSDLFTKVYDLLKSDLNIVKSDKWSIDANDTLTQVIHIWHKDGRRWDEGIELKGYKTNVDAGTNFKTSQMGKFKINDRRSVLNWILSLIDSGEIETERSPEGKLFDMGFTDKYARKLYVNKENTLALKVVGRKMIVISEKTYDSDLKLTYVDVQMSKHPRDFCADIEIDFGGQLGYGPEAVFSILEKYDLAQFDQHDADELNVLWMEEFAATNLRSRIAQERKLAEHMKYVQRLHAQYNLNAEKYSITPASPLNSYASYRRFEQTLAVGFERFCEFEITNYLISNGLASQGVADGVKSEEVISPEQIWKAKQLGVSRNLVNKRSKWANIK